MSRNARIRVILFSIYLVLYGGFVLASALTPDVMDVEPLDGINLAVIYGFVLIIGAFLLAVVYGMLCGPEESEATKEEVEQ